MSLRQPSITLIFRIGHMDGIRAGASRLITLIALSALAFEMKVSGTAIVS
jgi:hypothetical protein